MTKQTQSDLELLRYYMPTAEWLTVRRALQGEERAHFAAKLAELRATIANMPRPYQTDGQGDSAIVHLHCFTAFGDWWIVERDVDEREPLQCYGVAKVWETERGYFDICELIRNGAELDLHFTPCTVADVMKGN